MPRRRRVRVALRLVALDNPDRLPCAVRGGCTRVARRLAIYGPALFGQFRVCEQHARVLLDRATRGEPLGCAARPASCSSPTASTRGAPLTVSAGSRREPTT